jgi:hypothetical protein
MTLPQALRFQMEETGTTHHQLAQELETFSPNVSRWINLGSQPTPKFYDGLCDFLDISFDELCVLIISTEREKDSRGPL